MDYSKTPEVDSGGFIDSSSFYKQFIVVDDNVEPYQLLGDFTDQENYGSFYKNSEIGSPGKGISMKSIVTAVCPLPEKVFLTANKVRTVARKLFSAYKTRIRSGSEPIVLRLFLTTSTSFQQRKGQAIDKSNMDMLSYGVTHMKLPHFIWVAEAGPLSLYLQGKCTSEIVIDPTSNPNEDIVMYMRVKNAIIVDETEYKVDTASPEIPQYTHNLGVGEA